MNYFTETKTNEEFHTNGKLSYTETIAYLLPVTAHYFDNASKRINDMGEWIRIGRNAKYWANGKLHWELNYDQMGNVIKDGKNPSYRKDGTIIVY